MGVVGVTAVRPQYLWVKMVQHVHSKTLHLFCAQCVMMNWFARYGRWRQWSRKVWCCLHIQPRCATLTILYPNYLCLSSEDPRSVKLASVAAEWSSPQPCAYSGIFPSLFTLSWLQWSKYLHLPPASPPSKFLWVFTSTLIANEC